MQNFTPMKPQAPLVDDEILQLLDRYEMTKKPFMTPTEGYQSPNTEPQIRQAIEATAQMDVPEVEPLVPELDTEMFPGGSSYSPIDVTSSFGGTESSPTPETEMGDVDKKDSVRLGEQRFDQLLGEYENLAAKQQEQLSQAQGRDDQIRLANNLNKTFAQMNAAIANRGGITDIKAQPIDAPVAQVSATKDLMSSEKGILDARMQTIKAQLQREFDRRRIEAQEIQNEESRNLRLKQIENQEKIANDRLDVEREKIASRETIAEKRTLAGGEGTFEKEEAKAEVKAYRSVQDAGATAVEKLDELQRVANLIQEEDAQALVSTGPILGGLKSYISPKAQQLEASLNALSLDTMTKMFAGMSKAIDSDAERKFFQRAQPDMRNRPGVNLALVTAARSAQLKAREEAKAQREHRLNNPDDGLTSYISPVKGLTHAVINPQTNEMLLVPKGETPEGFVYWEDYANQLMKSGLPSAGEMKLNRAQGARQSGTPDGQSTQGQVVRRRTKDGRTALFDSQTKEFIRHED